jgi:hypothetical protein
LIQILDPAAVERDADQERGHALGDRAQIVQLAGVVGDAVKRPAPFLVLAGEIMLVDEGAVPRDDDGVDIRLFPLLEARTDRAQHHRVEPLRLGSSDVPPVMQFGRLAAFGRVGRAGA